MSWLTSAFREVKRTAKKAVDIYSDAQESIGIGKDLRLDNMLKFQAGIETSLGIGSDLTIAGAIGLPFKEKDNVDDIITKGFPLPTNFDLTIGSGQLKSNLAAQRKRGQSRFSGGLTGGSFAAPTLFTT